MSGLSNVTIRRPRFLSRSTYAARRSLGCATVVHPVAPALCNWARAHTLIFQLTLPPNTNNSRSRCCSWEVVEITKGLTICALSMIALHGTPIMAESHWVAVPYIDRMTDKKTVWYQTDSVGGFPCSTGEGTATILLTCDSGKPKALLGTSTCYFLDEEVFSFRVGQRKRQMVWATPQSSSKAVHLGAIVDKEDASLLVKEILEGSELIVELAPSGAPRVIVEFAVDGLAETVGPEFSACKAALR